jgi:hypothetical protein
LKWPDFDQLALSGGGEAFALIFSGDGSGNI